VKRKERKLVRFQTLLVLLAVKQVVLVVVEVVVVVVEVVVVVVEVVVVVVGVVRQMERRKGLQMHHWRHSQCLNRCSVKNQTHYWMAVVLSRLAVSHFAVVVVVARVVHQKETMAVLQRQCWEGLVLYLVHQTHCCWWVVVLFLPVVVVVVHQKETMAVLQRHCCYCCWRWWLLLQVVEHVLLVVVAVVHQKERPTVFHGVSCCYWLF